MQQSNLVEWLREAANDEDVFAAEQDFWHAELLREAADEIERLRALTNDAPVERLVEKVKTLIGAWESLPGGNHRPATVEAWLSGSIAPAVDGLRAALTTAPTAPVVPDREKLRTAINRGYVAWLGNAKISLADHIADALIAGPGDEPDRIGLAGAAK